jgi:hypothetical protein
MLDVQARYLSLVERRPGLRWYALIDGWQHEQRTGEWLCPAPRVNRALFEETENAALAHAGPWLHDLCADATRAHDWAALEREAPCVSWLITAMDLQGLSQVLRLKLDSALPDGRRALLRFYDPRVLANLFNTFGDEQRASFFELIEEWHFLLNGQRRWIGRPSHA